MRPHTDRPAYRLGYSAWAFGFLAKASRTLGRRTAAAIARTTASLYTRANPDIVAVVAANCSLLEGREVSQADASENFTQFALTLADYLWLGSRSIEQGFVLADLDGGFEALRAARESGKGAILATGHFGFFEFGALVMCRMGFPISVVTHAEPSPALTTWRAAYRRRWGAETIELGTDAFSSLRANEALERGRFTAMLVDRPTGGRNLDINIPGGRIPFSMSPAILSWMTGCAILPVTVRRTPNARYAIQAGQPIEVDRSLSRNDAIAECTRRMADSLIQAFRRNPRQWYHFVPLAR